MTLSLVKKKKEHGVTNLVVEKGSEQNALYTVFTLKMQLNCLNNNCPHIIIWLVGIYKKKPHSFLNKAITFCEMDSKLH